MTLLIIVIVLAIIFDFINGFHDAANSIATVVTTKVLTPTQAVIWAAFFNFIAYFIAVHFLGGFGESIANTVAKTVESEFITTQVVMAGLIAAITWNLITWWFGIPSSSSHTLIGGFAGAGIAASGFQAVHLETVGFIAIFIVAAPLIGMASGMIITILTQHVVKKVPSRKADRWFKGLQLLSSALLSIGHGLNDSQKVIGIIGALLIANQHLPNLPHWMEMTNMGEMHDWIPLACFTAIAAGTMSGGWKIMKTMGSRITKIGSMEGFCAQMSGSVTLFISEALRVPVSTTHVITGSIMGVGSVKRLSAVRWGVAGNLVWAWVLTIPVSALLAGAFFYIIRWLGI